MAKRKPAVRAATIPWKPTAAQWKLLAAPERNLPPKLAALFSGLPPEEPAFAPGDLDQLFDCLADELDNTENLAKAKRLAALARRVETMLHAYAHLLPKQPRSASRPDPQRVHQILIALADSNPPIWRRIQVKDCTLDELHGHIQSAMGWTNSHLHHLLVGRHRYGDPTMLDDDEVEDSLRVTVAAAAPNPQRKKTFGYEYDFGDGWTHVVTVERGLAPEPGQKYPQSIDGARSCPPEDVGGVYGYENSFLPALANKRHPEHRQYREWIGGAFDPENFSAAAATKRMRGK